MCIAVMCD